MTVVKLESVNFVEIDSFTKDIERNMLEKKKGIG